MTSSRNLRALLCVASMALGIGATAQSFVIPNGSFESPTAPAIPGATQTIDVWTQTAPQFPIDPVAWDQSSGIFLNAPSGPRHITNADGNQVAYFFPLAGLEITQQLSGTFAVGSAYTVTIGLRGSPDLTVGNTFDVGLFYMDGANRVNIATTTATSTSAYQTTTELFDISATLPTVLSGDAWAGQNIGIYLSATSFNGNGNTAYWEADNVRLSAVPEPSEYAMIAGVGLVAAALWRRRNTVR